MRLTAAQKQKVYQRQVRRLEQISDALGRAMRDGDVLIVRLEAAVKRLELVVRQLRQAAAATVRYPVRPE